MAIWDNIEITLDNGTKAIAQAPEIISVSRSTDIPAFYTDWFIHRLKIGYSAWTNPFNGIKSYISYQNTKFIVFWSKNPRPLLKHLDYLKERNIKFYIQYTLNDYENECLEPGVPKLSTRIDTFKQFVDILGIGSVIWRYDPLILTETVGIDKLLNKIDYIGNQLKGYTEKLVFSYADIALYQKVKANMSKSGVLYREWDEAQMHDFAQRLSNMNKVNDWNFKLASCGEKIDLYQYGIIHNHCIDDALIIRFAHNDYELMNFLGVKIYEMPMPDLFNESESLPSDAIVLNNGTYATRKNNRDRGQRKYCGCMKSKDIGEYNTCMHLCTYCYANASKEVAVKNWGKHTQSPMSDTIKGG